MNESVGVSSKGEGGLTPADDTFTGNESVHGPPEAKEQARILSTEDFKGKTSIQLHQLLSRSEFVETVDEGLIPGECIRRHDFPPGICKISVSSPTDFANANQQHSRLSEHPDGQGECIRRHPFSQLEPKYETEQEAYDAVDGVVRFVSIKDAARLGENGLLHWVLSQ